MKAHAAALVSTAALVLLPTHAAAVSSGEKPSPGPAWVHQIGTYSYLESPDYDGLAPIRDAARDASIGLGTFDRLNGELVMLAGVVYRVGVDGKPQEVSQGRSTPFLQTADFRADRTRNLPKGTSCADLVAVIDKLAGTAAGIVPVRLKGRFAQLTTRSVPPQAKPYLPLPEALGQQVTFDLSGRRATLVGFRTGADLAGLSPVGLHLHGLTRNRGAGGHVVSCRTGRVSVSVQRTNAVRVTTGP